MAGRARLGHPVPIVRLRHVLLVAVALAAPATARAEGATIVSRDVPLPAAPAGATRSLASAAPRFNLVGLHWRGRGTVSFRTRNLAGRWSSWHPAAPETEDQPDRGARERSVRGWRVGNPYWTGGSDAIQYRLRGDVRRLRAHFVWSPADAAPPRALALAGSPPIIPRLSWGANEAIRRAKPEYAPEVRYAIVHHTAGSNRYTRAQSLAIVRGIQVYHVRGNGWDDIGYNFLVDRFGQVFEGRFGGIERPVIGAHAQGFNKGSTGVAVLGSYGGAGISAAARAALVQTLAWRLDVAHVDPLTALPVLSGGNPRFPKGTPVFLRAIVGHRDTGFTACPGGVLYAQLFSLAAEVGATGVPKLYAPSVRGTIGGPVRFTATLSAELPWNVTVSDAQGRPVASGTGTGTAVDWTWQAVGALPATYSYVISAGADVRPAVGTFGARPASLAITAAQALPATVTPNGDGIEDSAVVSYRLNGSAYVTATLVDATGRSLATLFADAKTAGQHSFTFTPDASVPPGRYRIVLRATGPAGQVATATAAVTVLRP